MENYLETIAKVPLFTGIEGDDLKRMLGCLGPIVRTLGEGELALSAGDAVKSVGVVLRGCVRGVRIGADGKEALIARIGEGQIYGEILACTDGRASPVSVYAEKKSVVMLIDFERLVGVCPSACVNHTALIRNMLRVISRQYFDLHDNIGYLMRKGMRARLSAYLYDQSGRGAVPQFDLPLSRSALADYLGVDRSAMSRELGRMKRDGIIDCYRSSFKILDVDRLRAYDRK